MGVLEVNAHINHLELYSNFSSLHSARLHLQLHATCHTSPATNSLQCSGIATEHTEKAGYLPQDVSLEMCMGKSTNISSKHVSFRLDKVFV